MSEVNKWTVKNLIENLSKNKDAVIVIGEKAVKELDLFPVSDNTKDVLNKKNMVRNPKEFWEYYREHIISQVFGSSKAERALSNLLRTNVVKTVIDLNYTGYISEFCEDNSNKIQLKGDMDTYRCMSCNKEEGFTMDMFDTSKVLKCDCGGKIAPSVTLFGDKYLDKNIQAVKDSIFIEDGDKVKLNTHCLIFIGVDFEEDYINELIDSYDAVKKEVSTNEDPYFTVIITDNDWTSIEYYQPEFATNENIDESITRLTTQIKEA